MAKADRILCVASDPIRRAALTEPLATHFEVLPAATGGEALAAIRAKRPVFAALVDAQLQGASGAQLLAYIRIAAPETARILVARALDLEAAATAVNEAEVARIVVEPFTSAHLFLTLDGIRARAGRGVGESSPDSGRALVLLKRVLARARPQAHKRAQRVARLLAGLRDDARIDAAVLEAAVYCHEAASVALPEALLERQLANQRLTDEETQLIQAAPRTRAELFSGITELQLALEVAERAGRRLLDDLDAPYEARALRIALDFDVLIQGGLAEPLALDTLHGRGGSYDVELLGAFGRGLGTVRSGSAVRELSVKHVATGMVFAEDVRTRTGSLLIARGREATPNIVRHIRQYAAGQVVEPVRVIVAHAES